MPDLDELLRSHDELRAAVIISAPMFCLVMFQGVSCHFESAASDSYSPMGQIEV